MRERKRGVSLSDIARSVGVNESTASRALNGYPDIAEATRLKIAEAAARLNYQPSPAARRLARGTPETIGYILPIYDGAASDPFVSEMVSGISQALAEKDWDLLVTTVASPDQELDTYRRLTHSGKVSGMIVTRTYLHDLRIQFLLEEGVPFVAFGRSAQPKHYAYVDVDNEGAFETATSYLVELGHIRIGHIGADPKLNLSRLRLEGYRRGMKLAGLACPPEYLVTAELSAAGGKKAMRQLLDLPAPPTAVLCVTDMVALGACQEARRRGLVVGRDISLIGYDGLPAGQFTNPPLTTLAPPVARSGRRLTEILIEIVEGADPQNYSEMLNARLIRRASAGPPLTAASETELETQEGGLR